MRATIAVAIPATGLTLLRTLAHGVAVLALAGGTAAARARYRR
ncbi:hypothetical protein [Candidatus Rariloculus sp.]